MPVPLVPEAKLFLAVFRQAALDLRSGNPRLEGGARPWVLERGGTFDWYAYALASLTGDLKINEVVDVPHVLVGRHRPKAIFR